MRLCENEKPALAILDVVMPKLGGPATGEKLTERYGPIPIIFTSGYSQDSESFAVTPENAQYLQKPYSPIMLGSLVRQILDKPKSQAEAT